MGSYQTDTDDCSETWEGAEKPIVTFEEYYPQPELEEGELPTDKEERLRAMRLTQPPPLRYSKSKISDVTKVRRDSCRSYRIRDYKSVQLHKHRKKLRIKKVPPIVSNVNWPMKPIHPCPSIMSSDKQTNVPTIMNEKYTHSEIWNALKPGNKLPHRPSRPRIIKKRNRRRGEPTVPPQDDRVPDTNSTITQHINLIRQTTEPTEQLQQLWTLSYDIYAAIDGQDDYVPGELGPREHSFEDLEPQEYMRQDALSRINVIHDIPYYPRYCTRIRYEDTDVFASPHSKAHCVSADMHMGMGVAKQFRLKYRNVQALFMQQCRPGRVAILTPFETRVADEYIFYLITKTRYYEKPLLRVIEASLIEMCDLAMTFNIHDISMPMIATGLDRLKWTDVYYILAKTLKTITRDYDLTITVHRHDETKDKQYITLKLPRTKVGKITIANPGCVDYLDLANSVDSWPCFNVTPLATRDYGTDTTDSDSGSSD